jgi:hypothetical protein
MGGFMLAHFNSIHSARSIASALRSLSINAQRRHRLIGARTFDGQPMVLRSTTLVARYRPGTHRRGLVQYASAEIVVVTWRHEVSNSLFLFSHCTHFLRLRRGSG